MRFELIFKGVKISTNIKSNEIFDNVICYDFEQQEIGIELLEKFNLKSEALEWNYIKRQYDYVIYVSIADELAKESGLFKEYNSIFVLVPKNFLNDFFEIKYIESDKILYYVLNENKLIEFWINSGFKTCFIDEKSVEIKKLEIEQREKEREERKKFEEEQKEKYIKDREEWIFTHGSDYLKDCLSLGYSANREYVVERAALEIPDYTVDYDRNADWGTIVSPIPKALEEIKRLKIEYTHLNAEIVWLTHPAYDSEDYDYNDYPVEAIVINNYLNQYRLIKEF